MRFSSSLVTLRQQAGINISPTYPYSWKNCRNVPSLKASRAKIRNVRRWFIDADVRDKRVSRLADHSSAIPHKTFDTRTFRLCPGDFSTLLDKKWVHRFVYVNPVAFSKLGRSGRRFSKIFSNSARLRLGYFHEKCLQPLQYAVATIRIGKCGSWGDDYERLCSRVMFKSSCAICINLA